MRLKWATVAFLFVIFGVVVFLVWNYGWVIVYWLIFSTPGPIVLAIITLVGIILLFWGARKKGKTIRIDFH